MVTLPVGHHFNTDLNVVKVCTDIHSIVLCSEGGHTFLTGATLLTKSRLFLKILFVPFRSNIVGVMLLCMFVHWIAAINWNESHRDKGL